MSRSIRISERTAKTLLAMFENVNGLLPVSFPLLSPYHDIHQEIQRALQPRRSVLARRKLVSKKKRSKREETRGIYEAVAKRANGRCESCARCSGVTPFGSGIGSKYRLELDHFFGRRGPQSERTCWLICQKCHHRKTSNTPDAAWWLNGFIVHCESHGYASEASRARRRLEALELVEQAAKVGGGA